jgi:hypothetical protein
MEKLNARWGYGMFLGVRSRSGELIVVDSESKQVKNVRTVKRVLEEQRWDANNLEWVSTVPWNKGANDKDADGDLPEFDVKKGPGQTAHGGGEAGDRDERGPEDHPPSTLEEVGLR